MREAKQCAVGFLDILGFSNLINTRIQDAEFLNQLDRILEKEIRIVSGGSSSITTLIEARLFSDCFCICCPIERDQSQIIDFLAAVACFQRSLAVRGIYVRGGIEIGLHFSTPRLIFSKGLVDAYAIESKVARYPRVVLSESVREHSRTALETYSGYFARVLKDPPERTRAYYEELIWQDSDGEYFLNFYADMRGFDYSSSMFQEAWAHKKSVEKWISDGLVEGVTQSKLEKFEWLVKYHNKAIEPFAEDDDFLVDNGILAP